MRILRISFLLLSIYSDPKISTVDYHRQLQDPLTDNNIKHINRSASGKEYLFMKIICKKSDLQKSISIVSKAVSSKTTMPILETILINASAAEIHFTANDMELGIDTIVEGTIQEKGMVALDAKLFSEIVRKLPENDVIITSDTNNSTQITCEKAKFSIMGQSGEDFPYLPYVEKDYQITISQFTLKEVIRQTIFSIAANDSNKIMTGELFDINGSEMRVVSLDGHRISIRKILLKSEYEPKKVIVPGKTLTEISKILTGGNGRYCRYLFYK